MASPATGPTNLGMAPNVGGLLCYAPCCIGLVFSVVAVIVEKQSRFLRFHAFQSLLFHAAAFVLSIAFQIGVTVLGFMSHGLAFIASMFMLVIGLGILAFSIFLMVKAYNGEEFEIPTLGQMARKWA
jgi:uncharacterized membrane protein